MRSRIVETPWSVVACDLMEFPRSKKGRKYLIVFQDLFSKWIEIKPFRKADYKSVTLALEELLLFRWETPKYLLTDNGGVFDSKYFKDMLVRYGIKRITTPLYHTQANPVERTNRTSKTIIAAYVQQDHRDWDLHIHEFRHAVNTAIHTTNKVSPAFLNYGRNPVTVGSLRREVEQEDLSQKLSPEFWKERLKYLNELRDLVVKFMIKSREKQVKIKNLGIKENLFKVGDLVVKKVHSLSDGKKGINSKLAPKFEGPFKISEILSLEVYLLKLNKEKGRKINEVHVKELKKYIPPRSNQIYFNYCCLLFSD